MQNIIAAATAAAIADGLRKAESDTNQSAGNDGNNNNLNSNSSPDRLILNRMQKENSTLRRGKWTAEEEAYSTRLIQEFRNGLLPISDGTTLRTFLSIMLNCDPMRISKKFTGGNCIGKQVFKKCKEFPDAKTMDKMHRELAKLEQQHVDRIAANNSGAKSPGSSVNGCSVSSSTRRSKLNNLKIETKQLAIDCKEEANLSSVKSEPIPSVISSNDRTAALSGTSNYFPTDSPDDSGRCVDLSPMFNVPNESFGYVKSAQISNLKMEENECVNNIYRRSDAHDPSTVRDTEKKLKNTSISTVESYETSSDQLKDTNNNDEMPRVQSVNIFPFGMINGSASIQDLAMLLGHNSQASTNHQQVCNSTGNLSTLDGESIHDHNLSTSIPAFFRDSNANDHTRGYSPVPPPSMQNSSSIDDFRSLLRDCCGNEYSGQYSNNIQMSSGYQARSFYLPGQVSFAPPKSVGQIMQAHTPAQPSQLQYPFHAAPPYPHHRYRHSEPFPHTYMTSMDVPITDREHSMGRHPMSPPLTMNSCPLHFIQEDGSGTCESAKREPSTETVMSSDDGINEINMVRHNSKRYAEFAEEEERSQRVKTDCDEQPT